MTWKNWPWTIICAAGIGGAAPNIIDLASTMVGAPPVVIPAWPYYVGIVLFFGMGAVVATIFHETDTRKAFFLGVSLPALIAAAQASPDHVSPVVVLANLVVNPASAQTVGDSSEPKTKNMILAPTEFMDPFAIIFYDENGKMVESTAIMESNTPQKIIVPGSAATYAFHSNNTNPAIEPVPDENEWGVQVEIKRNLWNDFRRGLGNFSIQPYDFAVEVKPKIDL